MDKTFVIPDGWMDSFTVLGITIDNRLKELQNSFQPIYDKVEKKLVSGSAMD